MTPISPISPSFFTTLCGNSLFSSHSETCGATSRSAKVRTSLRNCSCSSVNPNIATNSPFRKLTSLTHRTHRWTPRRTLPLQRRSAILGTFLGHHFASSGVQASASHFFCKNYPAPRSMNNGDNRRTPHPKEAPMRFTPLAALLLSLTPALIAQKTPPVHITKPAVTHPAPDKPV